MPQTVDELQAATGWNPILLAANAALVSMGTFAQPLDESLAGLTYGQWQLERAKRVVVAVLRAQEE